MQTSQAAGRAVTVIGGSLFLLAVAALSFSLYGEALSKTKSAVLMACSAIAVSIMAVGGYVQRVEANRRKRNRRSDRERRAAEKARMIAVWPNRDTPPGRL